MVIVIVIAIVTVVVVVILIVILAGRRVAPQTGVAGWPEHDCQLLKKFRDTLYLWTNGRRGGQQRGLARTLQCTVHGTVGGARFKLCRAKVRVDSEECSFGECVWKDRV